VSLRDKCPPVWDQGQLGSCTAHGTGAAYVMCSAGEGFADGTPSRLFLYYGARSLEGTTGEDSGATCRDAVKAVAKFGAPDESDWPYDIKKFTSKPPAKAFTDGQSHQALEYLGVSQSTQEMKAALAAGFPIIVGFSVYDSFESDAVAKSGLVDVPNKGEKQLGGHCVLLIGYDEANPHLWELRNSWGTDWGQDGYFRMAAAYLTNPRLSGDFWTIRKTEG